MRYRQQSAIGPHTHDDARRKSFGRSNMKTMRDKT
jgi:hypothetical protein